MLIYENKIGRSQAFDGTVCCFPHLHHHIELVYVYDGINDATVGANSYTLNKDDVLIAFPNQIHSYDSERMNKSYILIYSPDDFPEYNDIFNLKIPVNPVIRNADNEIKKLFKLIVMCHNSNNLYKNITERGYMLVLLSKIFNNLEFVDQNAFNLTTIQNVLLYCDNNFTSDISLEKIADELYISKFYVSHIFSEKIKVSFSDYINSLRIKNAIYQLTSTSTSITEISDNVGYKSIRSFNRQFANQTGLTPSKYRKMDLKRVKVT